MRKYIIECTEKQAAIISNSCELFARLDAGQLHAVYGYLLAKVGINEGVEIQDELFRLEKLLDNRKTEVGNMAWDIYQVLRNKIAWDKNPEGGFGVMFDKPFFTSKEKPVTVETISYD